MKPTIRRTARRPRNVAPPPLTLVYDDRASGPLDTDETDPPQPTTLVERLAAQVGEWVGTLSERWAPGYGPFFAADGQIAVCSAAFACEPAPDGAVVS